MGGKGPKGNGTLGAPKARVGEGDGGDRQPGREVDEEGFQLVRGRRSKPGKPVDGMDLGSSADAPAGGCEERELCGQLREEVDEEDGGGEEQGPSTDDLHKAWHGELALVKRLRQQGVAADHPVMLAACMARDDAEKRWRGAKDPTPPSVKLGRAQAKLDRAISIQAESRRAILDHERSYKERLAVLQTKMDEDTERVCLRRRQLDEVQASLGAGAGKSKVEAAHGEAVRQVRDSISKEVAPTLVALAEQLDTSTPAWTMLNSVLSSLSSSQALLDRAAETGGAQAFNIGDGAEANDEADHHGWDGSEWSESHELMGQDPHDERDRGHEEAGAARDQPMGSDYWWEDPGQQWHQSARWEARGHSKWQRSSWADSLEQEREDEATSGNPPAAVRRRLDPSVDAPAEGGGAAAPTPTVDEAAETAARRQQHANRVAHIIQRAIDRGVQPLTDEGEELQLLGPQQLAAWVETKLPGEPLW